MEENNQEIESVEEIPVVEGTANTGDIYLSFDKNKAELGKEGYEIEIAREPEKLDYTLRSYLRL